MSAPIARRIRRRFLVISLGMLTIVVLAVMVAYDDLEKTMLSLDFSEDHSFFMGYIDTDQSLSWETAALTALYVPARQIGAVSKPSIFRNRPFPFSGEVDWNGKTWLVSIDQAGNGRLYVAKDISRFEHREALFATILAGLFVAIALISLVLARSVARPLAAPLADLTNSIRRIRPGKKMGRIDQNYPDSELVDISGSVNLLLEELESYIHREQSLLSLASHELRTPIAVISGAAEVLARRGKLDEPDRRTLERIERAAAEMQRNVDVLLALSRSPEQDIAPQPVDMAALLFDCLDDCRALDDRAGERIAIDASPIQVVTRPVMAKMLLRNLLQNALQHTEGSIRVGLDERGITVTDNGTGLPGDKRQLLATVGEGGDRLPPVSGLGLFIVTLLCERIGWHLQAGESPDGGTELRLTFDKGAVTDIAGIRDEGN